MGFIYDIESKYLRKCLEQKQFQHPALGRGLQYYVHVHVAASQATWYQLPTSAPSLPALP